MIGLLLWLYAFFMALVPGLTTHYGTSYNGGALSCDTGYYDSTDPGIVAVGYGSPWKCGDALWVMGPAGNVVVTVQDRCQGCGAYHLDMSEAGQARVCGYLGVCNVQIYPLRGSP